MNNFKPGDSWGQLVVLDVVQRFESKRIGAVTESRHYRYMQFKCNCGNTIELDYADAIRLKKKEFRDCGCGTEPPKARMVYLTVYLPLPMIEFVEMVAERQGTNQSKAVLSVLNEFKARWEAEAAVPIKPAKYLKARPVPESV